MEIEHITDDHMHIDPEKGLGIEAAKQFKRAGGTCLFLVNKMSGDLGVSIRKGRDFERVFSRTIRLAQKVGSETGLQIFSVIGVHPAELVNLCSVHGVAKALMISKEAVDIAGKMITDGRAAALGEMGRPHYEVDEKLSSASNELLVHAMTVASEADCAIQLHTETSSESLFSELSGMAKKAGLEPERVVKHFCGPHPDLGEKYRIMPSIISSKENLREALKKGTRFLMESDYIDDSRRPGAVLGPKTVPRVTHRLIEEGLMTLEDAVRIHKDNVEKTYDVEIKS